MIAKYGNGKGFWPTIYQEYNQKQYETGTAMDARKSENYLPISRSSSASK
jgi:hypothetical protein